MNKIKKLGWLLVASLLLPATTFAQLTKPSKGDTGLPDLTGGKGIAGLIDNIITIVLLFAGIVAVLFLIIGGYQYIISAGNQELAEQGKKTIQNAIIGIIIIILSYTVVTVIFRTLAG